MPPVASAPVLQCVSARSPGAKSSARRRPCAGRPRAGRGQLLARSSSAAADPRRRQGALRAQRALHRPGQVHRGGARRAEQRGGRLEALRIERQAVGGRQADRRRAAHRQAPDRVGHLLRAARSAARAPRPAAASGRGAPGRRRPSGAAQPSSVDHEADRHRARGRAWTSGTRDAAAGEEVADVAGAHAGDRVAAGVRHLARMSFSVEPTPTPRAVRSLRPLVEMPVIRVLPWKVTVSLRG